ncbi:reverse transcriptase N-terminal domain-containing protein [Cylindrospermopsis raciborskii]|uniref:reverse transcriptase N-terminal domain-containing protein n=1 Tax=Cylindrospermopsis raciborskii TaxID=77022 RepID=UPI000778D057|nr:reverse transcriptase N-terminal domain-containing protein [Cylindrospermopsis raciborskii]MCZ2201596.1 reverse transcriptase N-terminal domain-containing protein [Cylindrospermopsis raciborskii PAMP2012]MCZ2206999.1 reverse transcriptase N-terminal domain-containing protein [Cylindrospermopsis raciborskii PAMP2011]
MSKAENNLRMEWKNNGSVPGEIGSDVNWQEIPWKKLERHVFKLQKRIYKASQRGDVKTVHKLQKLLIKSWSARCIAVKGVFPPNQGGKSFSPEQKLVLARELSVIAKSLLVRKNLSLVVFAIYNQALTLLISMAMSPEWDAKFNFGLHEANSDISCYNAVRSIRREVVKKPKYVLAGELAESFQGVNPEYFLKQLNTFPLLGKQIKLWLKLGFLNHQQFSLSSLLLGAALGELERRINWSLTSLIADSNQAGITTSSCDVIPYFVKHRGGFVLVHQDLEVIILCENIITQWLSEVGLELKGEGIRVSHSLYDYQGNVGCNFLGFYIRQFVTQDKLHDQSSQNSDLGSPHYKTSHNTSYSTLISISKESLEHHTQSLGAIIDQHRSAKQSVLISRLNPLIERWTKYYSPLISDRIFSKVDFELHSKLRAWSRRRHNQKGKRWISKKYWSIRRGGWRFCHQNSEGKTYELMKHQHIHQDLKLRKRESRSE